MASCEIALGNSGAMQEGDKKISRGTEAVGRLLLSTATMAANLPATKSTTTTLSQEKRHRSIFEVPPNFFDSCRLLPSPHSSVPDHHGLDQTLEPSSNDVVAVDAPQNAVVSAPRWTCNTCKTQFDSLQDQRSHFKSDIHRFNVKLTIAGKNIVKEEDFEVLTSEFVKDYDVSSISGSESDDDSEIESQSQNVVRDKSGESFKQKLFFCLQTGQRVSLWKCLIMNVTENVLYENEKVENEVVDKLKSLSVEPRDNTHLRIVLLASGGHFAGCVFDGDAVVAHKTFHRYVVRAKAGKKQSSKDASGRAAHSAGASLRRYNELALKKEVQELLTAWKPYFDASNCIFIHAPSSSRQLLYDGERSYFTNQQGAIRNIALSVRRPTFREAKRVYSQLTQVTYEADEKEVLQSNREDLVSIHVSTINGSPTASKGDVAELDDTDKAEACSSKQNDKLPILSNGESDNELFSKSTPLHQAAQSGDSLKVLELLEQGLDPCIKDERERTPYMLAHDKEVRNTFRRFMASNLDKWDWHAAKVPSALTKEMEESQAAKQAEKDAKRKAKAKELKKLRKAKEKKAQAEAALPKNDSKTIQKQVTAPAFIKGQSQLRSGVQLSKEDEIRMSHAAEREKRAAAAERRIAALKIQATGATTATAPSMSEPKSGLAGDIYCSCCNSSLAGKVPFHRYNYKYCSTSCMHVHREILEDQ
ncbi:Ankyrin repeat and zinc finger domain-containing protein 1 [Spatholobus suberectus]|nr:Ankyrin repeat and zinc finger domain-containing protein 1 [Spatholobus suberectus]